MEPELEERIYRINRTEKSKTEKVRKIINNMDDKTRQMLESEVVYAFSYLKERVSLSLDDLTGIGIHQPEWNALNQTHKEYNERLAKLMCSSLAHILSNYSELTASWKEGLRVWYSYLGAGQKLNLNPIQRSVGVQSDVLGLANDGNGYISEGRYHPRGVFTEDRNPIDLFLASFGDEEIDFSDSTFLSKYCQTPDEQSSEADRVQRTLANPVYPVFANVDPDLAYELNDNPEKADELTLFPPHLHRETTENLRNNQLGPVMYKPDSAIVVQVPSSKPQVIERLINRGYTIGRTEDLRRAA